MYIFCKELPVWYGINYYAKDGGQGAVRHLYSFHHDPLQQLALHLNRYKAHIHELD